MREIKFRGLTPTGFWVYGLLAYSGATHSRILHRRVVGGGYFDSYDWVKTETVGQYTGLCDKNGKEIYEGDIVDFAEFRYDGSDRPRRGVVCFRDAGFRVEVDKENIFDLWWVINQDDEAKVIGNIHENPELLKCAAE